MITESGTSAELKKEQILNNDILNYLLEFEKFDDSGALKLKSKIKLKKKLINSEAQIKKLINGKIELKNKITQYNDEYKLIKLTNKKLIKVIKEKLNL